MQQEYIVNKGQTLKDQTFEYSDTIIVKDGGSLEDVVIPETVNSVTLDAGAKLAGDISTAKEFTLAGSVDASSADLNMDISDRKPEETVMVSDYSLLTPESITVTVSADQDKGTYRLLGNAADFAGTITVKSTSGTTLGELSITNNVLDYDITHYVLSVNEVNEICVTVSSNIPDTEDYILLYKNASLITEAKELYNVVLSTAGEYDTAIVLRNGVIQTIQISSNTELVLKAGSRAENICQDLRGSISACLSEGDNITFSGTNAYGAFSYDGATAENIAVGTNSEMIIGAGITVHDVHMNGGYLSITEGAVLSGNIYYPVQCGTQNKFELYGGLIKNATVVSESFYDSWSDDKYHQDYSTTALNIVNGIVADSDLSAVDIILYGSGSFENSVFGDVHFNVGSITYPGQGTYELSGVTFTGKSWSTGTFRIGSGGLTLKDTLFCGTIDGQGNTLTLDLTSRTEKDDAIIGNMSGISEDTYFRVELGENQSAGIYKLASNVGSMIDSFLISVNGNDIGTLSAEKTSFQYGNWVYTLQYSASTQVLNLEVSISDNAPDDYRTWCYMNDGTVLHSSQFTGLDLAEKEWYKLSVYNQGKVSNLTLSEGTELVLKAGSRAENICQDLRGSISACLSEGDNITFSGTNAYGVFSYDGATAENIAVGTNSEMIIGAGITVHDVHMNGGYLSITEGAVLSGNIYYPVQCNTQNKFELYGGIIKNATVVSESFYDSWSDDKYHQGYSTTALNIINGIVADSDLSAADVILYGSGSFENSVFGDVHFNVGSRTYPGQGTYELSGVTFTGKSWSTGTFRIGSGGLTLKDTLFWGTIDGQGNTLTLDLTSRIEKDDAMIGRLSSVRNTELLLIVAQASYIGSYFLAGAASQIGQGDAKGVWNPDTNEWDYQGSPIGDIDGIIEIRDNDGILIANCTVNGDTEYFGRYNYTVRTDENGNMYLDIGWNTREGRTYEADGLDNNTMETAVFLPESGTKLTIDSASDVDWFKFTMEETGHASSYVGIDFKQWAGDLDLYLYDGQGNLIDYARSVTDKESISLRGLAEGDYYLKVEGYEGNLGNYTLNYSLPEKQVLTDEYEQTDAYALGTIEGEKQIHAAVQTTGDVDRYTFSTNRKGITADAVTLSFDPEYGDLDLYLYDVSGKFLLGKSVSTENGTETISLKGLSAGTYVTEILSKEGLSVADYDLSFNIRSTEITPDKYENNNTLEKAKNLFTLNGEDGLKNLSIHDEKDEDFFQFSIKEKGSADDWISIDCEASWGDLDLEILDSTGTVVVSSRTAENTDTVSLKDLEIGDYYIRVYGYENVANSYELSWNVTNSSLIPSDSYEGNEPIAIREDQTITGLSIAKVREKDETREDVFKISLEYDAWKRSKIILSDYRSDWEEGMAYILKDADGNVLQEGKGSEISLAGLTKGDYYLTVDTPNENEYSTYSVTAQSLPDSDADVNNTWSIFVYLAGDNNLEGCYLNELLYMQRAILPEDVEVYVLMDRAEGYSYAQRDWTDTRVGKIRHSEGGAVAVEWMYFDGVNTSTYMNTSNLDQMKEWDTGDVATLEAFLDWGMQTAPAEHYALIVKDHGSSLGYNSSDYGSGSIMSITDIAELLSDTKYDRVEVTAFDQCLMGSDVVISTMEGNVDYVVASEAVGYTPNQLMMYKVLFNSLTTDMTAQELAQKMVKACNCSGVWDLTLASFHTEDATLSSALNAFGEAAAGFSRQDWVALCRSFAQAYNYGDTICAYSDLGMLLNTVKSYSTSISSNLLNAVETLYDVVMNSVIDSTMITPATYGTGLAVFNPVLSDDMMNLYSYGGGSTLDYYATEIGQDEWGEFLYTVGQLADDCSEYFVDASAGLTFTDFSYWFDDDKVQTTYNLGAFGGRGVEYNGLYVDKKAYFTITLDKAGIEGDAITVTADNPDAEITLTLIQQELTSDGEISQSLRRVSDNGVLSLEGINPDRARIHSEDASVLTEYVLVVSSDAETTYNLSMDAYWTSGSDYFDYSRAGNQLGKQGNGSLEKATVLTAGNYGGLVTYAGDADYYQLNTVYADSLDVVIAGDGLTVQEKDAEGNVLEIAEYSGGEYTIKVASGNYLFVEGDADITQNQVNSYSMNISDVAQTYLKAAVVVVKPDAPELTQEQTSDTVTITATADEGLEISYSTDLTNWTNADGNTVAVTEEGIYYFRAYDPAKKLYSSYTSIEVTDIAPAAPGNPVGNSDGVSWTDVSPSNSFIVEYSTDNFAHTFQVHVSKNELDTWNLPAGTYQWRVRFDNGTEEWATGENIVSDASVSMPQTFQSDSDTISDVFFVQTSEAWTNEYAAQHTGCGTWSGTGELVELAGKNKITDVFEGSADANILILTDDEDGDALFVDDIYSSFPAGQQSRIAQIDEIRAGAGDDIVDMTSQRFEYIGDGLTIRGGEGNDTIWANKGNNMLFGDTGNDRIVGASGNDVIVGGIGDDSMHGGGGNDIFCFCEGWGTDTVEQLSDGSVTLWFVSGSEANWNQDTMTYTDGSSTVQVTGVSEVTLKFGDDSSELYDTLAASGCCMSESSERIFEEEGKGLIAVL